ncbi:MAG: hypothetical protein ACKOLA_13685 [Spartobacteria bacterium]
MFATGFRARGKVNDAGGLQRKLQIIKRKKTLSSISLIIVMCRHYHPMFAQPTVRIAPETLRKNKRASGREMPSPADVAIFFPSSREILLRPRNRSGIGFTG